MLVNRARLKVLPSSTVHKTFVMHLTQTKGVRRAVLSRTERQINLFAQEINQQEDVWREKEKEAVFALEVLR